MDWWAPVDNYCERVDASFWSEPLNALSNLAFVIAAFIAMHRAARSRDRIIDMPVFALGALVAVIGIGSFLFHTLANGWSLLADILPITAFIYSYFFLIMRRAFRLSWASASGATALFLGFGVGAGAMVPEGWLNGSGGYLPAWFAMVGIGAILRGRSHPAADSILAAAVLFTLSLTFRSLDQVACGAWPAGLHWLWHILNAATLYLLLSGSRACAYGRGSGVRRAVGGRDVDAW